MDVVTLDEVRTRLLKETPVQWPILLQQAELRMGEAGFTSLRDFIVKPITKGGLGISMDRAKELLYFNPAYHHQADALAKTIGIEPLAAHGGDRTGEQGDNVTLKDRGNNTSYTLARLKRDRPELLDRVLDGELSANAAAIQAGFRTKTITVPLDAKRAARSLVKHFSVDELAILKKYIIDATVNKE